MARADEQPGVRAMDDDECEMAFELAIGGADGVGEVASVVALDEVSDHLGVGLGREAVALGLERSLQLAVVLDDPVEDQRHVAVLTAGERVSVLLAHAAVCRPACVADARRRARGHGRRFVLQELEIADCADVLEPHRPSRSARPAES